MRNNKFLICGILWTVFITVVSLISVDEAPKVDIPFTDKIVHAGVYFVLTVLWFLYFSLESASNTLNKNALWIAITFASLFGAFIELLQDILTSYRHAEWMDVVANVTGIIFAGIAIKIVNNHTNLLKRKN